MNGANGDDNYPLSCGANITDSLTCMHRQSALGVLMFVFHHGACLAAISPKNVCFFMAPSILSEIQLIS